MRLVPRDTIGFASVVWLGLAMLTSFAEAQQFGQNPLRGARPRSSNASPRRGAMPVLVKAAKYEKPAPAATSVLGQTKILQDPTPIEIEIDGVAEDLQPMVGSGDCCDVGLCCAPGCCLTLCDSLRMGAFEVFGGAVGFTGPVNRGESNSFGFQYGANWGGPMPCMACGRLGAQVGIRGVNSDFSGADFTPDDRSQIFVTGGLFQRTDCGLQGGAVVDFLHDDWYYTYDLTQVRGEVSWVFPSQNELGIWFNASNSTQESPVVLQNQLNPTVESFQATDIYAFFFRRKLDDCGTEGRFFVGGSGDKDAIIGADFNLPLSDCLAIDSGFSYLIPEEGTGAGGNVGESWNVSVNLVWYPGLQSICGRKHYRPLFRVAGNDTFFVDRN